MPDDIMSRWAGPKSWRTRSPSGFPSGAYESMHRHIIVSGDDALAMTIIDELKNAGVTIARLANLDLSEAGVSRELALAEVGHALAVVCAGDDDAVNLEIALLARKANPNARVVARLANDVLREAIADDNGPGAILNVAELAAPSVVEACLEHTTHQFEAAGIEFVVSGGEAYRDATLRELYGDLAPVAVIHGDGSPTPGEMEVCPSRDQRVHAGDWTMMVGTADEVAAQGIKIRGMRRTRTRQPRLRRAFDAVRALVNDFNPAFYPIVAGCAAAAESLHGVVAVRLPRPAADGLGRRGLLHHRDDDHDRLRRLQLRAPAHLAAGVRRPPDVQRGDHYRFVGRVRRRRAAVAPLRFRGRAPAGASSAQPHCRRRIERAWHPRGQRSDRRRVRRGGDREQRGEQLLVGGTEARRAGDLRRRHVRPDTPIGASGSRPRGSGADSRRHDQHRNRDRAHRDAGHQGSARLNWTDVPLVLRVYDNTLGFAVAQRFGFENVRSTVELAAPWFIGAAVGLQVLGTFSVGQRSFVVGGMQVARGSELDGLRMFELSTQTRVIAITRPNALVKLHPRRDARLHADDTVYLVGPYRELLDTLRKGRPPQQPAADAPAHN